MYLSPFRRVCMTTSHSSCPRHTQDLKEASEWITSRVKASQWADGEKEKEKETTKTTTEDLGEGPSSQPPSSPQVTASMKASSKMRSCMMMHDDEEVA